MKKTRIINLDVGGASWEGWTFGPWGRARCWRIFDPRGTCYQVCEIAQIRSSVLEIDFLERRVRELEGLVAAQSAYFNLQEIATLHAAVAILTRLPRPRRLKAA